MVNQFGKTASLLYSPFHPFAIIESAIPFTGLTVDNPFIAPWNFGKTWQQIKDVNRRMKEDPEGTMGPWTRFGAGIGRRDPNIEQGKVDQAIVKGLDFLEEKNTWWSKSVKPAAQGMFDLKKFWDNFLWNELHPTIKIFSMETMYNHMRENFEQRGIPWNDDVQRENIARTVNDGFGGQEWEIYIWATPEVRRLMHVGMFSPDWTISAANIAGATSLPGLNQLVPPLSVTQKEFMIKRYWPVMAAIVLFGIPNALQALIWATGGDDEEDDVPFTYMNEIGKRTHIDFTPWLRRLGWVPGIGYRGGDSGKRRVYLRWGKQAYEVFEGWYQHPVTTAMNKMSIAGRIAFEQATGTSTGGFALPFKSDGLMDFMVSDGSFFNSRAGYIGRKFLPFSIVQLLQKQPVGFFAPASRGASMGTAIFHMKQLLEGYADPPTWRKISQSEKLVTNLDNLTLEWINAAERNGIDGREAFKRAKSFTLSKYYKNFFRALNNEDDKALEVHAQSILRLGGTINSVERSMENRFGAVDRTFTPEMREAARKALREVDTGVR
jgi:hypothetical protein